MTFASFPPQKFVHSLTTDKEESIFCQLLFSTVSHIPVSPVCVTVVFVVPAVVLLLRRTLALGGWYSCFVCWSSLLQIPAGMHL